MSETRYDAHPSMIRMRPFTIVLTLLLMGGGILVAVLGERIVPAAILELLLGQVDGKTLQTIGIAVFVLATFQLLIWWVSSRADRLVITEDELLWSHGLLNKQYTEISMASVRTVRVSQSLLQRLMNAGDIRIFTAGDLPEMTLRGLPEPARIRELIKTPTASGG